VWITPAVYQAAGGLERDPGLITAGHRGLVRFDLLAGQLRVEAMFVGMA
jgi:hypothetical protein